MGTWRDVGLILLIGRKLMPLNCARLVKLVGALIILLHQSDGNLCNCSEGVLPVLGKGTCLPFPAVFANLLACVVF